MAEEARPTAQLTIRIDDDLNNRFRELIVKVKGWKQGVLKQAVEEAIELWISENRGKKA